MHVNIRDSTNISRNFQKSLNPLNPYIHNIMAFKIPYENDDYKATSRKPLFTPNIKLDLLQFRRAISLKIHNTVRFQKMNIIKDNANQNENKPL